MLSKKVIYTMGFLALSSIACSVYVEDRDHNQDEQAKPADDEKQAESHGLCSATDQSFKNTKAMCSEDHKFGYIPNCEDGKCVEVDVSVLYDHEQKILENRTIVVEAFRREDCAGRAEASAWTARFNTKNSDGTDTRLYLEPGVYYVRSYLSLPGETPKPRSYRNKTFKNDKPTGHYGAMSAVAQVIVHPDNTKEQNFVELYIDELWDDEAKPEETTSTDTSSQPVVHE